MNVTHPHHCPPSASTTITIALAGVAVEMTRCSGCDGQWWTRDGERVPLPELLPLLRESRNAVPTARRAARRPAATSPRAGSPSPTPPPAAAPVTARSAPEPAPTVRREVDLTEAEEGSLLFRQLMAFQAAHGQG